jgi:hypothetical protein
MEKRMSKLASMGSAAVLASVLAAPAIAQHAVVHPSYQAQYDACPGHEPGNPYTKEEDYMAWSGWRARGGWDDRNDFNCVRASHPRHHGVVY